MIVPVAQKRPQFGAESNGILMTPEEFDQADFEDFEEGWRYELINGVLIVTPLALESEADPNEELGYWLRSYRDNHRHGTTLDCTLAERIVKTGKNRRRADRLIWAGLGRRPRRYETPTIIVEFVSKRKRDRVRDYETKRDEYLKLGIKEYWIIDRFQRILTVFSRKAGKVAQRTVREQQTYKTALLPGFELPLVKLLARADRWADVEDETE